ncbi:MAG: GNAT family N-acetyltransferase [Actinophytocola sp.]|uniref:GNAT family N-acetyltransferase n=1 Tax=Actinophytocola sp. TaxID=1872138 RepID=UPI00132ACB65|nr:GNAT family N-acetyltransferase [Actinophytocola sp.]MPZ82673.1 GNAT family N-acetyltransferase [Actinophytocola sp.]
MITVDVLDPRVDPEPPDWAGFVAAQQLLAPWDYGLLAVESAGGPRPVLLALVRRDRVVLAALTVLVARRGRGPRWVEVFQQWISGVPGWVFAEGLDVVERKEILRAAERALCRYVGLSCLGLVYWHLSPADVPLVAGFGRFVRPAAGTAVLDNTFASTGEWLAALSRNRRASLRKLRRQLAGDPNLVIRFEPARHDLDGAELAAMLGAHQDKYHRYRHDSRNPVTAEYLSALVSRPDVRTMTYHDADGTLLAFSTLLDHPAHLLSQHFAAVPAGDGGRGHLYFDLYTHLVDHLVERGGKSLSVGRGMDEVKTRLGFRIEPLRLAIVPRVVAG